MNRYRGSAARLASDEHLVGAVQEHPRDRPRPRIGWVSPFVSQQ